MSEQALLMPPKADAEAFDLDAHLAGLKAEPKEVYQEAITPPAPEPEPAKPDPEPEPEKKAESTADDGATARVVLEMYNWTTTKLCEALVDEPGRYPAKHFEMEPTLRVITEQQLAKGIEQSGRNLRIPWYWAVLALLTVSGLMQWLAVKAARKERKERHEREEQARHQAEQVRRNPAHAVAPNSITKANGEHVATAPPVQAPLNFGNCVECGKPLEKKGKKYCSQSCAGHARKGRKAATKTTTP